MSNTRPDGGEPATEFIPTAPAVAAPEPLTGFAAGVTGITLLVAGVWGLHLFSPAGGVTISAGLSMAMVIAGLTLAVVESIKDRPFLRNRGVWLVLLGFLGIVVPRHGWLPAIFCDIVVFLIFLLYQSYWWALTKASHFGSWVYENSIGRLVNSAKKTKPSERNGDDHGN